MKIKQNALARNKEFLSKHQVLWRETNKSRLNKSNALDITHKSKSKSIWLNTVIENHIFWIEEMLMEWDSHFTTAVCSSYDAVVIVLKIDDIIKLVSFNDANKRLGEYWYNILTLFSENLEKCIDLEKSNYLISNNQESGYK